MVNPQPMEDGKFLMKCLIKDIGKAYHLVQRPKSIRCKEIKLRWQN
jgi:hypothetical protein